MNQTGSSGHIFPSGHPVAEAIPLLKSFQRNLSQLPTERNRPSGQYFLQRDLVIQTLLHHHLRAAKVHRAMRPGIPVLLLVNLLNITPTSRKWPKIKAVFQ
jgi:hypothetical protein